MKIFKSVEFRRWLYGVLIAVVVFLGGEGVISSAQQDNIVGIISAVLVTGVIGGGYGLAIRKASVAPADVPVVPDILLVESAAAVQAQAELEDPVLPTAMPFEGKHVAI